MPEEIPKELAANLAAYRTPSAVEEFSVYHLHPDEKSLFPKYFKAGETLLDLACGMGRTTLILYEMGLKVRGIDRSDVFIEVAKRRLPYLDLRAGSYTEIDETDASFQNVLVSFNGIDYAFPHEQRLAALKECIRVLKPGGVLMYSSHNIKSLHWFSPYYRSNLRWKLRNCLRAFKTWDYILEGDAYTFYAMPEFVIQQAEKLGLQFLEACGFAKFTSRKLDRYFSPYLLYVFRRPDDQT